MGGFKRNSSNTTRTSPGMLACSSIVRFLLISASISAARTEMASCVGLQNVLEAKADVLAHLEAQLASLLPQIEKARAAVRDMQLEVNECASMQGLAASDPSCNCLGEAAHPKLGSRRTINVIAPGW